MRKTTTTTATRRPGAKDDYLKLVKQLPLVRLKSARQHRAAAAQLSRLVGRSEPRLTAGEEDYLDALATLVAAYEREHHGIDVSAVSPPAVVRHLMAEAGLTISALARELGLGQSNLSEMLGGKRDFSKAAIRALCGRFRLQPSLFLRSR